MIKLKKTAQKMIAVCLAAALLITGISFTSAGNIDAQAAGNDVYRLTGKTRYYTSISIAEQIRKEQAIQQFDAVILTTGQKFADALSGSYLSYVKNAPIILLDDAGIYSGAPDNAICSYVKRYLKEGGDIYVLGGTGAVPDTVLETLKNSSKNFTLTRIKGKDRYETNLEILKAAGAASDSLIVATGKNYADSLSAAAAKMPILLVGDELTDTQKSYISSANISKIYVVGGSSAVSEEIYNQLDDWGAATNRISGKTRYETSRDIAKKLVSSADSIVLAYGNNYPDGLCGALLATATNSAILLCNDKLAADTEAHIEAAGITSGYVLGGTGVLKDETVAEVFDISADAIKVLEWE